MRRPARGLVLLLFSGLMLLGCGGGKKTAPPAVAKITLTPSSGSVNQGDTLQFFALPLDASGKPLSNVTITLSSSNTSVATVSKGGLLCAGTWDTNFVVCTPGAVGSAQITASGGGVTSGAVTVFVHQKVTSVTLSPVNVNCVSVGSTQLFTATALNGGTDITSTVGTFAFTSNNASVVTVDSNGLATAKTPGGAGIFATVSGVNSATSNFVTCPPKSISLVTGSTTTPFSFTLSSGGTQQLTATVVDTQGNMLSGLALTYVSLNPVSLAVSSTGLASPTSPIAPGSGAIVAACTPPNCNSGLYPVYSNAVLGTVSGNSNPTTVYATSSMAPPTGTDIRLIPIDTGSNTVGTAIKLPNVPNSLLFNLAGTKAFLGSDASLMILDAAAGTVTANTSLKGKVLAVSPNGNKVMVSDAAGGKLYAFDTSSSGGIETFSVAGATAAAFAPDSFKAYVVAGSNLYVYIPGAILRPIALSAAAADVAFLPSGAFAYLAGGASSAITTRASCDNSLADTVALPATPLLVGAAPDASQVLAVDNSAIDSIVVTVNPTGCPPGVTDVPTAHGFGQGAFTPQRLILTPDAKHAYVTSNLGVLLAYDVTAGAASTIALSGGATQTFTGGATLDSNSVYIGVAAGANGVHRIDVATGADATAIPTPFLPDLVAVRPK